LDSFFCVVAYFSAMYKKQQGNLTIKVLKHLFLDVCFP